MFETVYKAVDAKVQPSVELINKTKTKMKQELNNSNKVVHINFYKYATIAACLVIFIGVLSVNTQKDIVMEQSPSINETVKDAYEPITGGNIGNNPFNSAFDSAISSGTVASINTQNSFLDNVVEFFENIIQWFHELLY